MPIPNLNRIELTDSLDVFANKVNVILDNALTVTDLTAGTLDASVKTLTISDSFQLPVGDTASRPADSVGSIRYNTDLNSFEGFSEGAWTLVGKTDAETLGGLNPSQFLRSDAADTFTELTGSTIEVSSATVNSILTAGVLSTDNGIISTVTSGNINVSSTVTANAIDVNVVDTLSMTVGTVQSTTVQTTDLTSINDITVGGVVVGRGAGTNNANNVAVGRIALASNTSGSGNTGVGATAMNVNTSGSNNTAIGFGAGIKLTSGSNNVFMGVGSGDEFTTESNNVVLGSYNGTNPIDMSGTDNNIIISDGSGRISIHKDPSNALIFYTESTPFGGLPLESMRLTSDGRLGIGNKTPSESLSVSGNISASQGLESQSLSTNSIFSRTIDNFALSGSGPIIQSGIEQNSGAFTTTFSVDRTGNVIANGDVTSFGNASDITLKENIERIDNAIEKVSKLKGYTFNYKSTPEKRITGVMAQEVQEVLPEAVYTTEDEKLAVRYGNMVGLLIEAINDQQKQIDELKQLLAEK